VEKPLIEDQTLSSGELKGFEPQPFVNLKVVRSTRYLKDYDILIANCDVLDFLRSVPDEEFHLVVTSPPYNIGKPYERKQEFGEYLKWQERVLSECVRVLKPTGSLCWEVGNYVDNGEIFPLDVYFYQIIRERLNLHLRNRIIWFFEHGLHASKRLSGRYETILWFSKGEDYKFNLDRIRVPQKYPGKTYYKGPKRGKPSANPLGKNPGDVWRVMAEDWSTLIWDIPNVKANHPEKTIHPAQFPIELVERLVLALTDPKDIVFDPFMGVGSTLLASILNGRIAVGVDKEKTYVDVALQRIEDLKAGKLRYRPLGTRKYIPTGREKVSRIPLEWWTG
jgi:adenine-specific DNA-methyltransferase